ncbi:hypothetical protein Q604_UNBC13769G0001, partial [human gut metagenome]
MTVCHIELAGCLIKNITGRKMPRLRRASIYYSTVTDFARLRGW